MKTFMMDDDEGRQAIARSGAQAIGDGERALADAGRTIYHEQQLGMAQARALALASFRQMVAAIAREN